jgi:hypothetical protein
MACPGKTDARIETGQEQMEALKDVSLETTEACLEKIEANQGKVGTEMEACLEEMKVETIVAPEDRSMDQEPAVVSRDPLKRRAKDDVVHTKPLNDDVREET